MEAEAPIDLAALDQKIETQTDVVAKASTSKRYSEIMHLQMLRDMRELLQDAYRLRCECSEQFRILTEKKERAPRELEKNDSPLAVVVDANPTTLLHVTDLLDEAGYSVLCAASNANAFAWLKQYEQRIVLLYIGLDAVEGCDGAQLALAAAKAWPATDILLSGGADVSHNEVPRLAAFLPKPFSDEDLLAKLKDIEGCRRVVCAASGAASR